MFRKTIMVTAVIAGVVVGLFGIPASSSPPAKATSIDASDHAAEQAPQPLCHGAQADLQVEVENRGVGKPLEISFRSNLPEAASMVYGLEMVDDRGRTVVEPTIAEAARIGAGKVHRESISLPSNLSDGYYALRLSAAAAGPSEETASSAAVFFKQENGQATRISDEEFYLESDANAAVSP